MGGKGALGEESRRAAQGRKAPGYGAPNNNSVPCSSFFAPGEGEGLPKLRPTKGKGELAFTSTRSAKPHRSVEPFFVTGTAALWCLLLTSAVAPGHSVTGTSWSPQRPAP